MTAVSNWKHAATEVPPQVSVVIATKDRPALLTRVLGCMQRQTLPDLEVIVVDDGSSPEVVEAYPLIWCGLDERFRLQLNPPGGGPGGTRNAGIRLARGEFVAFCDDDDTWVRDDHLETALKALNRFDGDVYLVNMRTSINGYSYRVGFLRQRWNKCSSACRSMRKAPFLMSESGTSLAICNTVHFTQTH